MAVTRTGRTNRRRGVKRSKRAPTPNESYPQDPDQYCGYNYRFCPESQQCVKIQRITRRTKKCTPGTRVCADQKCHDRPGIEGTVDRANYVAAQKKKNERQRARDDAQRTRLARGGARRTKRTKRMRRRKGKRTKKRR
jgi:hypothetical protein